VDEMKDDSDEEYAQFVKDVNAEWNNMNLETKLIFLAHFGFFDDIVKGNE
jgi:hypothetical protein